MGARGWEGEREGREVIRVSVLFRAFRAFLHHEDLKVPGRVLGEGAALFFLRTPGFQAGF